MDHRTNNALSTEGGSGHAYPAGATQLPLAPLPRPENQSQVNIPYTHSVPHLQTITTPSLGEPSYPSASGPSYCLPRTPPPPCWLHSHFPPKNR